MAPFLATARPEFNHEVGSADGFEVVFHHDHRVAGVAQPLEEGEQAVHVARMQPDGRFVEHVQRVHQLRAEGVGESDALGLAAAQRARGAVEREIAEPHVAEELHAVAGLAQHVAGHFAVEVGEGEAVDPFQEPVHGEFAHLGDVAPGDQHVQRLALQLGATASRADLRRLVLPQKDADVLLVALLFEVREKGEHALEAFHAGVEQGVARLGGEVAPGRIHGDLLAPGELGQRPALVVVARLGPRIDRALAQRALGVGHDQHFVILEHGAEPVAGGAGAARAVEGEELRRGAGRRGPVVGALEPFGEPQAVWRRAGRLGEQDQAVALTLGERRAHRVGQPTAQIGVHGQPVHDHQRLLGEGDVHELGEQLVEVLHGAVEAHPYEALRAEVLDHHFVRDLVGHVERERDREASAFGQRRDGVAHRLHRVGAHLASALRAHRVPKARPEQAQVVVDLGGGADRGARGLGGVLLFDGDGRRQAVYRVDVGLFHALQELARVGGQRFDVAALPLGVDRVEGERRLARSRRTGHHGDRPARDLEVEALEVVLAGAANDDRGFHTVRGNLLGEGADPCAPPQLKA